MSGSAGKANKTKDDSYELTGSWAGAWKIAAGVGGLGLLGSVAGAMSDPHRFAFSWMFAFITVLFVLPPNDLTGYIFEGTLLALLVFYMAGVRGRFRGPVPQATSEEEMRRLEAQFEHGLTEQGDEAAPAPSAGG